MLQSSLPTVVCDTGFTDRQPEHLPEIGRGGGSRTHGDRAYEAHLNLILPAVEIGGVDGYRPRMSLLAGQVHYLSATTPWKLASRPGAAPGKLSFGDSAAQAGARLNMEIGAAAGNCTRTSSVAGRRSAVKITAAGK